MADGLPASSAANSCHPLIFWAFAPLASPPATACLRGLTPARLLLADRLFGLPRASDRSASPESIDVTPES